MCVRISGCPTWRVRISPPRGGGSFIAISSIGGLIGSASLGRKYGISKAADIALIRNLAVEWGPKNVRANAIAPGLVRTDFARALVGRSGALQKNHARRSAWPHLEPDEIAGAAIYLASNASSFMSGQTVVIDGGCMGGRAAAQGRPHPASDAAALDQADPLRSFRDRFGVAGSGGFTPDGTSLGPLPRATPERIARLMREEWGQSLIRAWNEHGWIDLSRRCWR